MTCPGSAAMQKGIPDESSEYSDEGTAAHLLLSTCIETGNTPSFYLGRTIAVGSHPESEWDGAIFLEPEEPVDSCFELRRSYVVDESMAEHVEKVLNAILGDVGDDGVLVGEQRIGIGQWTGEDGAHGTSDACITRPGTLAVHDLKYGMGHEVSAVKNRQMLVYALGLRDEMDLAYGPFSKISITIHQPRLNHVSTWECTGEELDAFGAELKEKAAVALALYEQSDPKTLYGMVINNFQPALVASEDGCRWCKAKATCPAIEAAVMEATGDDYTVLDLDAQQLADKMERVPLIELWCKAVRGRLDSEILSGRAIPGWKLVQGKKGNRQWTDETGADKLLKRFLKSEERYKSSLITVTQAEEKITRIAKADPKKITKKTWATLNALVTQKAGGPSVAKDTDPRPQWVPPDSSEHFTIIPATESSPT